MSGMTSSSAARASLFALLAAVAAPAAVGCANPTDEEDAAVAESDVISRVKGSTLGSAYAKANRTYLSVRNIQLLSEVGALTDDIAGLAGRVDGIIANQPPDGRVSIPELLKMEAPGFIETLFPQEKAALPKLWTLLETTAAAPKSAAALPALPSLAPADASTAAGTLSAPAFLAIADLPEALKVAARRVELTHDSDSDQSTITVADLSAAIATPGPYTPAEIKQFEEIIKIFTAQAVSSIATRATVPAPFTATTTLAQIGATATIGVHDALELRETRSLWFSNPNYPEGATRVSFEARATRTLAVDAAPTEKVVVIFEGTEREAILAGNLNELDTGIATFEVWSNGERQSSRRIKFGSALAPTEEHLDLTHYADYALSAGGAPLFKNVVYATSRSVYNAGTSWSAEYLYGLAPVAAPPNTDAGALAQLATPTSVTAGRYEIAAGKAGQIRIDVSPTGVVFVTRLATGATMQAYIHSWVDGPNFHAQFPDRFRVMLNGRTSQLKIFFDGSSILNDSVLRAADRTG